MSDIYEKLIGVAEKSYADFHKKIANTSKRVLGVRMPVLRKMAKEYDYYELKGEVDDIYEIVMLKALTLVRLPYDEFLAELDGFLAVVDSWAFIDCMLSGCKVIENNAQKAIEDLRYLTGKGEFFKRFYIVFVMNYAPCDEHAKSIVRGIKTGEYYVDMAIAWYLSVLFTIDFDGAVEQAKLFSPTIKAMAKRKCLDSFRLTKEQKIRIKNGIF